jgi:hypothetical protein
MEHDQQVIIKFPFNERCNANPIAERLEAQFHEDTYSLRSVQFGLKKSRESEKTCMMRNDPEDAPSKA